MLLGRSTDISHPTRKFLTLTVYLNILQRRN